MLRAEARIQAAAAGAVVRSEDHRRREVALHRAGEQQRQAGQAEIAAREAAILVVDEDRVVRRANGDFEERVVGQHARAAERIVVDRADVRHRRQGHVGAEHERAVQADAFTGVVGVVEPTAVDAPLVARLPVHAQDVFAAIAILRDLRRVVGGWCRCRSAADTC